MTAQHQSDAAWIARKRARENPPVPKDVTGQQLRDAAQRFNEADEEHRAAHAALREASDRAIAASDARQAAKDDYLRASRDYAATLARKKAQEGKTS